MLGLSKIMICIQYVMIILNYYDYITLTAYFEFLDYSWVQYNMIQWSYLIIIIMYSSATKMYNSGAVYAIFGHVGTTFQQEHFNLT